MIHLAPKSRCDSLRDWTVAWHMVVDASFFASYVARLVYPYRLSKF